MLYKYKKHIAEENGEKFYVLADSVETIDTRQIEIIFDGISKEWYSSLSRKKRLSASFRELKPSLFRLVGDKGVLSNMAEKLLAYKKFGRRWLELTINDVKGLEIGQFIDNAENSEVLIRFIQSIEVLSPKNQISQSLNSYFSWKYLKRREIKFKRSLIDRLNQAVHINVYNVGQGSLNAVCDVNQIPLLYFDMGGGFAWNRHTYPKSLKLCWTKAKVIILSHWDLDHLETARRAVHSGWSDFKNKIWIAPEQPLSPTYAKLASHIASTGKLMLWPNNKIRSVAIGNVELAKCQGPHKNHSGIALIVNSTFKSNRTLHPGDSAYKYLRAKIRKKLSGLVATHHGAEFSDNNFPVPLATDGKIVYSYGSGNTYGHPKKNAEIAHASHGWIKRKDTSLVGHVSFLSPLPVASCTNCRGANCDLCTVNHF